MEEISGEMNTQAGVSFSGSGINCVALLESFQGPRRTAGGGGLAAQVALIKKYN